MTAFPFPAIVGMDRTKLALILLAVDPGLKGVLIAGGRGAAKSLLARSFRDFLARDLPFVEAPLGVTEDRLLGGLHLEQTLRTGRRELIEGLIAQANGGYLYADGVNLLERRLTCHIAGALGSGFLQVERDGFSALAAADFALIGTYDPSDGEVGAQLVDSVGIHVAEASPLSHSQRVEMMRRNARRPLGLAAEFAGESALLRKRIADARERLPRVTVAPEDYGRLSRTALSLGVEGHRAEVFAIRLARAHASLAGRACVGESDLEAAVRFVLAPRAKSSPDAGHESEPDQGTGTVREQPDPESAGDRAEDLVLPALDARIPDELLSLPFKNTAAASPAGQRKRNNIGAVNLTRGRYIRPVSRETAKVALGATLRSAVLSQAGRRRPKSGSNAIRVAAADLRYQQFKLDAGLLVIFAIDTSGSMALNRISHAKGAVTRLLQQAYQQRCRVALVTFRGDRADVLLAPTRSVLLAKRALEEAPVGGGTPLAAGISASLDLARRASSDGPATLLVVLTDGCANVALRSRAVVWEELERLSTTARSQALASVVIDTSHRVISTGGAERLATLLGGQYVYLPRADGEAVYDVVSSAAKTVRAKAAAV